MSFTFNARRALVVRHSLPVVAPVVKSNVRQADGSYKSVVKSSATPLPAAENYKTSKLIEAGVPLKYTKTKVLAPSGVEGFMDNLENMTDEQFSGKKE